MDFPLSKPEHNNSLQDPPHRDLCTDCGVSRTANPKRCGYACQFIAPDYPRMEEQVHGRARRESQGDERFFGPYQIL
ncbi:MAG: hypothetical protein ACO3QT_07650, partial [Burkholderiaceae bacterium]